MSDGGSCQTAFLVGRMFNWVGKNYWNEKGLNYGRCKEDFRRHGHERFRKEMSKFSFDDLKTLDKLSSLTIKIPINAIDTVGVFYVITKTLNWENISIVEAVSTHTELTFILKEDDISLAFNVMKNLINA